MADVRRAAREWLGELEAHPGHSLFLVGLSGGGDSVALAWALSKEADALGVTVGAVVVDHGMQEDSAEVARSAAAQAEVLGLSPVVIKAVSVEPGGNIEERARVARYRAFTEALRETGASGVVVAHSQDDQAETVLLGLARGSGPSGLKGMARRDGHLHRPFLGLPRETLRQALTDAGLSWWEDPHNADDQFSRVKVRQSILPLMERDIGPGVSVSLARTAQLFREDSEELDSHADAWFTHNAHGDDDGSWSVMVNELEKLGPALQSRVLRTLVVRAGGGPPTFVHTQHIVSLVTRWRGQSAVDVTGASVERKDGRIVARKSA